MKHAKRDTREVVLDSAVRVFARRGYAGTSVENILEATGLSKPTLYYYFKSKAGLFRAILEFAYDEGFRLMQEGVTRADTCEEKLVEVAAAWFQFGEKNQDLTRLLFATTFAAKEEMPADSLDVAKRRRNIDFVRDLVDLGQRKGELGDSHTALEVTLGFYGTLSQHMRMHLLEPKGRLDRRRARRVVGLFLQGARKIS